MRFSACWLESLNTFTFEHVFAGEGQWDRGTNVSREVLARVSPMPQNRVPKDSGHAPSLRSPACPH